MIQFVDLKQKPMARGEIKRFIERFGLIGLLDAESKAYVDAGLKYLKISESELLDADRAGTELAPAAIDSWGQDTEHRSRYGVLDRDAREFLMEKKIFWLTFGVLGLIADFVLPLLVGTRGDHSHLRRSVGGSPTAATGFNTRVWRAIRSGDAIQFFPEEETAHQSKHIDPCLQKQRLAPK